MKQILCAVVAMWQASASAIQPTRFTPIDALCRPIPQDPAGVVAWDRALTAECAEESDEPRVDPVSCRLCHLFGIPAFAERATLAVNRDVDVDRQRVCAEGEPLAARVRFARQRVDDARAQLKAPAPSGFPWRWIVAGTSAAAAAAFATGAAVLFVQADGLFAERDRLTPDTVHQAERVQLHDAGQDKQSGAIALAVLAGAAAAGAVLALVLIDEVASDVRIWATPDDLGAGAIVGVEVRR